MSVKKIIRGELKTKSVGRRGGKSKHCGGCGVVVGGGGGGR